MFKIQEPRWADLLGDFNDNAFVDGKYIVIPNENRLGWFVILWSFPDNKTALECFDFWKRGF